MSKTMTNMSKEEKRMMLFDMQEHPEKYTDEQVERLLDDEEVKEFFRLFYHVELTDEQLQKVYNGTI